MNGMDHVAIHVGPAANYVALNKKLPVGSTDFTNSPIEIDIIY